MDVDPNSIEHLILEGAAEVAGMDMETQEVTYRFTPKLQEVNPELHNAITEHVHSGIMLLWEKGFLNIDMTSDEPMVTLTDKAFHESDVQELSSIEKNVLNNVIRHCQV